MADLGRAALVTSFLLFLYALVGGSLAAWKGRRRLAESAQNALLGSFAATVVATVVLLAALARETVLAEGVRGSFATLYAELGNLEMLGTARRGYFVEGLGGAQFALPGAVERLRSLPAEDGAYMILGATDPANPYGASLPWPKLEGNRRPARAPGAHLVLRDGEPVVYVERGGRGVLRLADLDAAALGEHHGRARRGGCRRDDPAARDREVRRGAGDRLRP